MAFLKWLLPDSLWSSALLLSSQPPPPKGIWNEETAHILSWQGKIQGSQSHLTGQNALSKVIYGPDKHPRPLRRHTRRAGLHGTKSSSALRSDVTAASSCMWSACRSTLTQIRGARPCHDRTSSGRLTYSTTTLDILTTHSRCLTYLSLNFRFIVNQWKHVYLICSMFGECRPGPPFLCVRTNVSLNKFKWTWPQSLCYFIQILSFYCNFNVILITNWSILIYRFKYFTLFSSHNWKGYCVLMKFCDESDE